MDHSEKIDLLIDNYSETWEYNGVEVRVDAPPTKIEKEGHLYLSCRPTFYVDGSQVQLPSSKYPFLWKDVSGYVDPMPQGEDAEVFVDQDPGEGFKRMINEIVKTNNIGG